MRKTHLRATLISLLAIASVNAASALSGGVSGPGTVESAIPLPYKTLVVDVGTSYYQGDDLGLRNPNGSKPVSTTAADRTDLVGAISYGFLPFLEGSFYYPWYRDYDLNGKPFSGLGDVRFSCKLNYPPYPHKKGFEVSLLAQLDLPTATDAGQNGGYTRHAWYTVPSASGDRTLNSFGAKGPTLITRMLTTANFGAIDGFVPLMLHLNWGAAFSGSSGQNAFLLGGGAEVTPYPAVTLFWSFNSEVPIGEAAKDIPIFSYPFGSSGGLQLNFPDYHVEVYGGMHFVINDYDNRYVPPNNAPKTAATNIRFPSLGWLAGISIPISLAPPPPPDDPVPAAKTVKPASASKGSKPDAATGESVSGAKN